MKPFHPVKLPCIVACLIVGLASAGRSCPPDCPTFQNSAIHSFTNIDSPKGKQHCLELVLPANDKNSSDGFWAAYSWKYPSPPWDGDLCANANKTGTWNYVNRRFADYNGFKNVTFTEYGMQ